LVWPVSRLENLMQGVLEIREVVTAKGLNKGGLDTTSVVTAVDRKNQQEGDTCQCDGF
jgi:hypothetical protein